MTLDPEPRTATAPPPPSPRAAGSLRLAVGAAFLAAALSSAGTAALLLGASPAAEEAAVPAATPGSPAGEPPSSTALARVDSGEAVAAVAAAIEPSVVTISDPTDARGGGGSGFVVSADGLVLTTTVVARRDVAYAVLLHDGSQVSARLVAADAARGLVLLRADAADLTPARLARGTSLAVGQLVVAVGSPLGEFTDTVTSGIVSSVGRSIDLRDPASGQRVSLSGLIQTDAAINAGSSGGPLLEAGGTVVGVIATSAGSGRGIGFAIPIDAAAELLDRAGS